LQYTSASRAIVFLYLAPFVVALGMPFIARSERLRPLQITGLCIAFASLALIFGDELSAQGAQPDQQWLGAICSRWPALPPGA
jgi:drug/metabolite transporter (DMT)-like permease